MDLKLVVFLNRFRIAVLHHPPFSKEASGIVAIIRVEESDDEAGAEDAASEGLPALGRG